MTRSTQSVEREARDSVSPAWGPVRWLVFMLLFGVAVGFVVWVWGAYRMLESKRARIVNIGVEFDVCDSPGEVRFDFVLPEGLYVPSVFIPFDEDVSFSGSLSVLVAYEIVVDGVVDAEGEERIEVDEAGLAGLRETQRTEGVLENAPHRFLSWPSLSYPWDAVAYSDRAGVLWSIAPHVLARAPVSTGRLRIRFEATSSIPLELCTWMVRMDSYWDI